MIALFQLIFLGHFHKWETIKESVYKEWPKEMGEGSPSKIATKYVCRCERCGKIKAFIA